MTYETSLPMQCSHSIRSPTHRIPSFIGHKIQALQYVTSYRPMESPKILPGMTTYIVSSVSLTCAYPMAIVPWSYSHASNLNGMSRVC